jgi:hypothetical protein
MVTFLVGSPKEYLVLGLQTVGFGPSCQNCCNKTNMERFLAHFGAGPKTPDGEINAIIAAMRRFPNLAKLQQNACLTLQNVLLSPESVDPVRYLTDNIRVVVNAAAARAVLIK